MLFFYTKATKEPANQESIEALATKPSYEDATGNNFLQGDKRDGVKTDCIEIETLIFYFIAQPSRKASAGSFRSLHPLFP